ncbi:CHASE2 domain-containing serine/threonine-protein kinase [Chitinimonas lacunae]|uniref:CHASE2 domain-containing serine/threonine-protein kinase n=1 Tax=Chitinimonas lacunae TaxID=1963018 RepID=A0ABV8MUY4_9NEIS
MKTAFWKADWFVGLLVLLVFFVVNRATPLLQSLELKAYDVGSSLAQRPPSDKIAVIAIDQASLDNIGRWPWSRDIHAQLLDRLSTAKPRVVANTVLFTEPQQDKGATYINQLLDLYRKEAGAVPEQFGRALREAAVRLDVDRQLADSVARTRNVVLAMHIEKGEPQGNPDEPTPPYVERHTLTPAGDPSAGMPYPGVRLLPPIQSIGARAAGLGHLVVFPDLADGVVRSEQLAMRYYNQLYPSFALAVAARSLNIDPQQVQLTFGEGVRLGGLDLKTSPEANYLPYFYRYADNRPPFAVDSFFDVYSGKVPVSKYRDKIVLIGTNVGGVGSLFVTPGSETTSPVMLAANNISSILQQHYFEIPAWGIWVEYALLLLVCLYLTLLLPRLSAGAGAAATAGAVALCLGLEFGLLAGKLVWLSLMTPAALLLVGHLVLTTKRFLVTERGKEQSELSAAESNRMLGLAFQGQGQLDMAFDKFRKVPMDPSMMDLLYNLALDFERKRQFNKAEAVYSHMASFDPKYKDLQQKLNRARQMSETVILGGANTRGNASTLMLEGAIEKPMLGRYQVEKELGKGAMGVVYLGRDPKIGRVVAIKTMALSQEFEAEELDEARARFFREAETAGRLNHPNIVTIYDAGEEHDLAYIAMEFLKGKDLAPYTKAGQLLPVKEVAQIVAQVAEALDYAHRQQVVHRDIKPANIMYELDTKTVKVTDFGIARITDSSKTKTGMVLGTPSYMSPEQLSGKKIDGRSDLFSLGVTLYQMTVGALPFQGDSMAELMFRIANDPYRNPRDLNPTLPAGLIPVIDRALKKNADERFQSGNEFAAALRQCFAAP